MGQYRIEQYFDLRNPKSTLVWPHSSVIYNDTCFTQNDVGNFQEDMIVVKLSTRH